MVGGLVERDGSETCARMLSRTWRHWTICSVATAVATVAATVTKAAATVAAIATKAAATVAATAAEQQQQRQQHQQHAPYSVSISRSQRTYQVTRNIISSSPSSNLLHVMYFLAWLHLLQEFVAISPFRAMPWFGNLKETASTAATTVATIATETAAVEAT